jgi:hypothetical protein
VAGRVLLGYRAASWQATRFHPSHRRLSQATNTMDHLQGLMCRSCSSHLGQCREYAPAQRRAHPSSPSHLTTSQHLQAKQPRQTCCMLRNDTRASRLHTTTMPRRPTLASTLPFPAPRPKVYEWCCRRGMPARIYCTKRYVRGMFRWRAAGAGCNRRPCQLRWEVVSVSRSTFCRRVAAQIAVQ